MLLRSLRIVHFRGIADLHVKHLAESGVQSVALPAGADPSTLAEALRFAFLGRTAKPTPWISAGEGFVFVEVAIRTRGGATASIFRGADRRGASQVSLREEEGARISSGAEEVRTRLAELVGAPVDSWDAATFLGDPAATQVPAEEPPDPAPAARPADTRVVAAVPSGRDATPSADLGAAAAAALAAVERMRRSLRAAALASEAEAGLGELVGLTRRLRGERAVVAKALDRSQVVRGPGATGRGTPAGATHPPSPVRLAPVADPAPGPGSAPMSPADLRSAPVPRWVETGLRTAALAVLGAFLLWASSAEARSDRGLGAVLTAALLVCTGAYAWVAWRWRIPVGPAAPADRSAADDRPATEPSPADPRGSVPPLPSAPVRTSAPRPREPETPRLQARLEEIDGALAQAELASRRAALLVRGSSAAAGSGGEAGSADAGGRLAAGETPSSVRTAADDLADRICRSSVERDALLARDAAPPRAAALGVEAAFARLARAGGDESRGAAALVRLGATADALERSPAAVDGDALAEVLRREVGRLGASSAGGRADGPARTPASPRVPELAGVAAAVSAAPTPGGRTREDPWRTDPAARVAGDAGPPRSAGSAADDLVARERAWLAGRLRRGDALLAGPVDGGPMVPARAVVLDRRPASFATDADLAALVAAESPRTTQIVVGAS